LNFSRSLRFHILGFVAVVTLQLPAPTVAQNVPRAVPTVSSAHNDGVKRLIFSPDGRQLASGGGDRLVKLWDVASGRMLQSFSGLPGPVDRLVFSVDGRQLVGSGGQKVLKKWSTETGELLWTIDPPDDKTSAQDFALTRDGQLLVNYSTPLIRRYDLDTAKRRGGINPFANVPTDLRIAFDFALAPDEKTMALAFTKKIITFNATTGVQLKLFETQADFIDDLAFSPDGHQLAAGDGNAIKIWNLDSGQTKSLAGSSQRVWQIAWSPDGKLLYSIAGADHAIRVWDTIKGTLIQKFEAPGYLNSLALSADGKMLATGGNLNGSDEIDLLDAQTGALLVRMQGSERAPVSLYPASKDGQWIALEGHSLQSWDITTGQVVRNLLPEAKDRIAAAGPDSKGRWLHATQDKDRLSLWDSANERNVATFSIADFGKEYFSAFSPDGSLIATNASSGNSHVHLIKIWDTSSGKRIRTLTIPMEYVFGPSFSPDGRWLIATAHDLNNHEWKLMVWDVASGQLAKTINADRELPNDAVYSPDQKFVAVSGGHPLTLYDIAAGQKLWSRPNLDNVKFASFAPDGATIVAREYENTDLAVFETRSGQPLRTLSGNIGTPNEFIFLQNGRRLLVGNSNGTSAIWDFQSGELLATIVQQQDGEWLTLTPEGFFVSSKGGGKLMHIVRGVETIGIEEVYQSLYRPDLVREKLAGDPRGLVRDAAANLDLNKVVASGSAPDVRLTLPGRALGSGNIDGNSVSAEAEIVDRGGGIGRVEWRVNGVTAGIDTPAPTSAGQPARLTRSLALDVGENVIEVVAYNGANLIASVPARANVAAQTSSPSIVPSQPTAPSAAPGPAPVAAAKPRLFVLVAGVNDYADKRFKLSYAVSDAKDIARGFQDASGSLYQSVEVKLMTDAEVTKARLDAAFTEMAGKASASDVFVLYLAGHGKTVDGRYYFIPQDFAVEGELTDKAINAAVKTKAIAQDQWQRWFASIPARKSAILFDTCDSGTLAGDETQQLEKGAANNRLSQATGRSILAASGGSQEALEGYHGHGLFTYEILDAINQADGDRNGTIEVNELAAYVYSQVSEISQKVFKQRQVPEMKITANYPLTRQTRLLQDEVTPVAEAKPTYQVAQAAQLQVQPSPGGTVVRSLSAKTPVTVLESRNGWSLIASEGKPMGYVATRDLAPMP
jgi:WD40 repeat protein/uncharacterized caspase-like protein